MTRLACFDMPTFLLFTRWFDVPDPAVSLSMNQPSRRSADILVFPITAFDLTGWFVCNLMNHSHIGRARLLSSRGGPYYVRLASYPRPDPEAPQAGCCYIADIPVGWANPFPRLIDLPTARRDRKPAQRRSAAGVPNRFMVSIHVRFRGRSTQE
jgi:hypothetical protein